MRVERRLAAILAADVTGYSRLMGADEEGTLRALKGHRKALIDPKIAEHRGRIVKTTGDGALVEFASVVDAVRCAVEIQRAMVERNVNVPPDMRITFRIGVNLGDIIIDGADIMGDGVNIAARLETLAEPGGVCLSDDAWRQVHAKVALPFVDTGLQSLKNIAEPVRVFALGAEAVVRLPLEAPAASGAARPRHRLLWVAAAALALALAVIGGGGWLALRPTAEAPMAGKPSIAVLAFSNMSDDARQDYFSDGISEDLITDLSKVSGLFVMARNSSFVYKGKAVPIVQVGRELDVRYVLEGSVRRAGGRIRITAQLIDTTTGAHVWAERYDRDLSDLFDLQDDVRKNIVAALAVKLTPTEQRRLTQHATNDPVAYDYYVQGLQLESFFTPEANREARALFQKAIARDPKFANAYAHLATTYALESEQRAGEGLAPDVEAVAIAEQAVRLDPESPQAHWGLGRLLLFQRQIDRGVAEIERAIEIDPNFADGHALHGMFMIIKGRAAQALADVERAQRINPNYPFWYLGMYGEAQFHLGKYEAAEATLKKAVERNPNWRDTRFFLAATYARLGKLDAAQWELDELRALGFDVSVRQFSRLFPYQERAYREDVVEALHKAGMPD
ncbi:MAG TPA: tetratricopeptide repeat protein [Alphaproteobacteria bacterium]